MPNTKQAKKRMVQDERRRLENKSKSSAMKTAIKKVLQAATPEDAQAALPRAMKRIDQAAKNNIIHKNNAARKKSRLVRHVAGKKK